MTMANEVLLEGIKLMFLISLIPVGVIALFTFSERWM